MFTLLHNTVAYLYKEGIDMRLGQFRLLGDIAHQLSYPMSKGCFFLFINKSHILLKAVWFDGTGLCLFIIRLEQGQFSWPQTATISGENSYKFCIIFALIYFFFCSRKIPNTISTISAYHKNPTTSGNSVELPVIYLSCTERVSDRK